MKHKLPKGKKITPLKKTSFRAGPLTEIIHTGKMTSNKKEALLKKFSAYLIKCQSHDRVNISIHGLSINDV